MAEGALFSVAGKLLNYLSEPALQEVASCWWARDDLKRLKDSIRIINARVRDAEKHQEEEKSDSVKEWLRRLRKVLYKAEDLFDEVMTVDQLNKREGKKLVKKVRILLSSSGPFYFNFKVAQEIKSIRQELNAIESDMKGLNLRVYDHYKDEHTFIGTNRETFSHVKSDTVIGREDDKNNIIKLLFDPNCLHESLSVIPIVGFGGLGKTTLAQLVFNDDKVKRNFDLVKWACIPEVTNKTVIFGKIYTSFGGRYNQGMSLEQLTSGISESIRNKKYLLVLDDIWDDNPNRWLDVKRLLECGEHGSKIIVTTRSDMVAKAVATIPEPYRLGVLTEEKSWDLFKSLAFANGHEKSRNPKFTSIGKEIVKICGNVPLVIRVVGSLLCSKGSEEEWEQYLKKVKLSKANIIDNNNIMPVLKLSYDCLSPALKQCFAYCSLYPKDSCFDKPYLIHLWTAQGYLEPSKEGLSLEEVGDQYFDELLWRNFLECYEDNDINVYKVYKMHDLMHDLAQTVAGDECIIVDSTAKVQCTDGVMHVALDLENTEYTLSPMLHTASKIRSLLILNKGFRFLGHNPSINYDNIKLGSLRALDVKDKVSLTVLKFVGDLRHLRYLNLKGAEMESLPNGMTRLVNLQTLILDGCPIREWPRGFTKLENLRTLGIFGCDALTDMPIGFEKMNKSLRELNRFIVGKSNGIDCLPALNLRGGLYIEFRRWRQETLLEAKTVNLEGNPHLTTIELDLNLDEEKEEKVSLLNDQVDLLLNTLHLPPNLELLEVSYFTGQRIPQRMVNELSKLVNITLLYCKNCRVLPRLSHLPCLKTIRISSLCVLEYVDEDEDENKEGNKSNSGARDYFQALELLYLRNMQELTGWSRVRVVDEQLFFPRLSRLTIHECPKLLSMPVAPTLESFCAISTTGQVVDSLLHSSHHQNTNSLKELILVDVVDGLETLMFGSQNSLRTLSISRCPSLRNISEGLHHLSILESLTISKCESLDVWDNMTMTMAAWQGLKSLRTLKISKISSLETLPHGIVCITTLQTLTIKHLPQLKALLPHHIHIHPAAFANLAHLRSLSIKNCSQLVSLPESSFPPPLQELDIIGCPFLTKRYQKPDGKYWHHIHHISHVSINGCSQSFNIQSMGDSESESCRVGH